MFCLVFDKLKYAAVTASQDFFLNFMYIRLFYKFMKFNLQLVDLVMRKPDIFGMRTAVGHIAACTVCSHNNPFAVI